MDLLKKAKERTQQKVQETMGTASKTEYDSEFQSLMNKSDAIKMHSERIMGAIENYIQPDPTIKILPGLKQEGPTKSERVGAHMGAFGETVKGEAISSPLEAGNDAFQQIGQAERQMYQTVAEKYIGPMKNFLTADCKTLDEERKKLNTIRLDMDTLKTKVNSSKSPDAPLLAKLQGAESEYKAQVEKVTKSIHGIEAQLPTLQKHLKCYIEAHLAFHKKATDILSDLNGKF